MLDPTADHEIFVSCMWVHSSKSALAGAPHSHYNTIMLKFMVVSGFLWLPVLMLRNNTCSAIEEEVVSKLWMYAPVYIRSDRVSP